MAGRISTAVKTTRRLNNTNTGLDITVPDYDVTSQGKSDYFKGPRVTFQLVVVANLNRWEKDEDAKSDEEFNVVHFTLDKTYTEFAKFRNALDKKYSGTYVPEITKKKNFAIVATPMTVRTESREQQVLLDAFMKWCACTAKIAESKLLLDFIGLGNEREVSVKKMKDTTVEGEYKQPRKQNKAEVEDLFDELSFTKDEDGDLFPVVEGSNEELQTTDLPAGSSDFLTRESRKEVGLFEKPVLTGNVSVDDDLLIVLNEDELGGSDTPTSGDANSLNADEDGLLNVEEDISNIASQIKAIPKSPSKSTSVVARPVNVSLASSSVDVESMKSEDFLSYIEENSEDTDTIDLGF